MKTVKPSVEILDDFNQAFVLKKIEKCGRVCYKSEGEITKDSAERFVRSLIKAGHESVLEHFSFSVRFICDRGVSHEIVRHRLASYSQESTRYCNYSHHRYDGEITVIEPFFIPVESVQYLAWKNACEVAERAYLALLESGASPEKARSVLPNSLKTELIMTTNLRGWRHFLGLRTDRKAHPQMREVADMLLELVQIRLPVFFEDI